MKNIKKILKPIFISLVAIIILAMLLLMRKYTTKEESTYIPHDINSVLSNINESKSLTPYDTTYNIWGEDITFRGGESKVSIAPGSSVEVVTKYFGNDVRFDFDHDGREDTAFMLTQETGSTGIFFYVTAVLNTEKGKVGLDGVFIGDRIAPQSMYMESGEVLVINFAERRVGQSFAESPTVGKTIKVKYDTDTLQFAEVVQN